MPKQAKSPFSIQLLVYMALLVAAQIVLSRFLVVELGPYRISFGSVATILAGLWLGPIPGGLVGLSADLLGCLIRGYYVNPFITCAAVLWGVLPGLSLLITAQMDKKRRLIGICVSILACGVLGSILLTTTGLVLIGGYHLAAILPGRLAQAAIMVPLHCLLSASIYFSPVTPVISRGLSRA